MTRNILLFLLIGLASCESSITPCGCAEAYFDIEFSMSKAANDDQKLEEIYEKLEDVAQKCNRLAEEMGHKEYLEAVVTCKRK